MVRILTDWYSPGLGSLGLMAGQVGVGLAAAYGHKSGIMKVLSNANLEIFVPRGLELWYVTPCPLGNSNRIGTDH